MNLRWDIVFLPPLGVYRRPQRTAASEALLLGLISAFAAGFLGYFIIGTFVLRGTVSPVISESGSGHHLCTPYSGMTGALGGWTPLSPVLLSSAAPPGAGGRVSVG